MKRDKVVVLLSGGMDSAVALYWAAEYYEIAAIMNFDYGQHGANLELQAATRLLGVLKVMHVGSDCEMAFQSLGIIKCSIRIPVVSSLTHNYGLDPSLKDAHDQPMTFVPGRNLIFISYSTSVAYDVNAKYIIGGWSSVDVDYPDCSQRFLVAAGVAASIAIGRDGVEGQQLYVKSPLSMLTKAGTVTMGEELGVPWALTRSCYAGGAEPCLECDSCLLRVRAFITADVRDPLVCDDAVWLRMVESHGTCIEEVDNESTS